MVLCNEQFVIIVCKVIEGKLLFMFPCNDQVRVSVDAEKALFYFKIPACSWLVPGLFFDVWCVGGLDNSNLESTDNNSNSVDFKFR